MKRKFLLNLILLLLLNFLVKPFWILGIDRSIQNVVGTESYGLYFSLFNFSWLFTMFLDFGITNFNNREISQHGHMLKSYLSKILGLKLVLGGIYFVLSSAVAVAIGYNRVARELLYMILLNQFLHFFILYLRSNISGLQLFKQDSFLSVCDRFILIIICSYLLWGSQNSFRIEWLVYSQTIAYGITALIALGFLWGKTGWIRIRVNWVYFRSILQKSLPFALLSLLMVIYYRIDSVMLERLLPDGTHQAGVYAQSFRLLDTLSMFPFLFSTLLLPMFSHMLSKNESVKSLSKFSFVLLMIPVLGFVLPAIFNAEEVMHLLYDEVSESSAHIFQILMLCLLAVSGSYIYGTLLTSDGQLKFLNRWAFISVLVNVVLNLVLIQRFQAVGCAIASCITQFLMFAVQFRQARNRFKIHFQLVYSLKLFLLIGVMFSAALMLKIYTQVGIYSIIIIPVASVLMALALQIFRLSSVFDLLKKVKT